MRQLTCGATNNSAPSWQTECLQMFHMYKGSKQNAIKHNIKHVHTWWLVSCIWLSPQHGHQSNKCGNQRQGESSSRKTNKNIENKPQKHIQFKKFKSVLYDADSRAHLRVSWAIWRFWFLSCSDSLENSTRQGSCLLTSSLTCLIKTDIF